MKSCLGVLTCNPVTPMKATAERKRKKHSFEKWKLWQIGLHTEQHYFYIWKGPLKSLEVNGSHSKYRIFYYHLQKYRTMDVCVDLASLFFTLTINPRAVQPLQMSFKLRRGEYKSGYLEHFLQVDIFSVYPAPPLLSNLFFFFYSLPLVYITLNERIHTEWFQSQSSSIPFICFGEGAVSSKCSVQSICPHLNNVE